MTELAIGVEQMCESFHSKVASQDGSSKNDSHRTSSKGDEVLKVTATGVMDTNVVAKEENFHKTANKLRLRREGSVRPGHWVLGPKIGMGAFGVVYVGMNTALGTLMAVKQIGTTRAVMTDIRREIELLKLLKHPNIVSYYGAEMLNSTLHISQEWVPGGSVARLLSKFGPFTLPVIRSYLSQLLEGLNFLHDCGVMHRDIKGSNILVSSEGVVKLCDFGGSKKLGSDALQKHTMRGSKCQVIRPHCQSNHKFYQPLNPHSLFLTSPILLRS